MNKRPIQELHRDEYIALSNQKADDWRWISSVNPSLLAVAGALFAAGVNGRQAYIVAISPVPLFLSVWHMARHARLQQRLITYLAEYAPRSHASWERDWAELQRDTELGIRERLRRPSGWNIWLVISVTVAIAVNLIPIVPTGAGHPYEGGPIASMLGGGLIVMGVLVVLFEDAGLQRDRREWREKWRNKRRVDVE